MAKEQGGRPVAEEYIISIIPELDKEKFSREKRKVEKELNKLVKEQNKQEKQKNQEAAKHNKHLKQSANLMSSMTKSGNSMASSAMAISGKVAIVVAAIKLIYELMNGITDKATEFSNKMITASSAFVDKRTRNIMATFGVGSQTATGIGSVMNLMGLTESDLKLMTPGQMQLFSRLMAQWQSGMESIDPQALSKFQQVMQSFQSEMASAKLQLQIELYKMLIEIAPELEYFFSQLIGLIKTFAKFINTPVIRELIGTLFEFVGTLIKCVTAIFQALSGDFKGAWETLTTDVSELSGSAGATYNNKTIVITQNSTNNYNGDTNSMYGLATSTMETESNIISNTYLK